MDNDIRARVAELFGTGQLFCAETVLKVIAEAGGKDADDLIRMATGFCSGASRTNGQCGAISGAIMGIGLYTGRSGPGQDYDATYSLVQEFVSSFKGKYDSINCYELIECDFSKPEGAERFAEEKLIHQCVDYAAYAVETAVCLLEENGYLERRISK